MATLSNNSASELALQIATEEVERALNVVHEANQQYIQACKMLARVKMEMARSTPHPWAGLTVYRIMTGAGIRSRIEHGKVVFKDIKDPDYGNAHIAPGSYYVLVDGKSAHMLTKEWELDLL
jgi:hypothetical protein